MPLLLPLLLASPALLQTSGDTRIDHAVVVHAENSIEGLSETEFRRIFRASQQFWPGNRPIELLMPKTGSSAKAVLLERVYGMNSNQLKRFWMKLIYQNKISSMPRTVGSAVVTSRMVERIGSSIAIVPDPDLLEGAGVKRVSIDGKLPGDPDYGLWTTPDLAAQADIPGRRRPTEASARLEAWEDASDPDPFPTLEVRLFGHGEFEYEKETTSGGVEKMSGFSIESLDTLVTSALSEHYSVLAEAIVEREEDGSYRVELERLLLKARYNDLLNVSFGRFLTGIGYWNSRYNHGEWLQTSIDRPEVLDFEDDTGLLPLHSVGISVEGAHHSEHASVDYTVEITNGRGPVQSMVQSGADANRSKALNLRLGVEPACVPGLRFGGGVYLDTLPENTDAAEGPLHGEVDETIENIFIAYENADWELMGEYFWLEHDESGALAKSKGWFVQVGRRLGDWTPYVRLDGLDRSDDTTYLDSTDDGETVAIGLRRELGGSSALTIQYENAEITADDGEVEETDTLVAQFSFAL